MVLISTMQYCKKTIKSKHDILCLGMLKEAEDELAKKMRNLKSKLHNNASEQSDQAAERQDLVDLEGVLTRFRIVKLLVSTILSLKYSGTVSLS